MRINPVLKNESKLVTRSIRFTLVLLFYIGLLSTAGIIVFTSRINSYYSQGMYLESVTITYTVLAIIQAALLMFIVPSLVATSICGEREKQTLDVLLSTTMSPLSIVFGKLFASVNRVILLIICAIPVYSLSLLIGGVSIRNIIELSIFFIVTTIFVGSIGIYISTRMKTSKTSTVVTYFLVLVIFVGIVIGTFIYIGYKYRYGSDIPDFPVVAYLSPTFGFMSLLEKQIGTQIFFIGSDFEGAMQYGYIISIVFQLVLSVIFILLSAYKLNPINKKKLIKNK